MKRIFKSWWLYPLLAFVLSRLLIFGGGMLAEVMLPTDPGHSTMAPDSPFLSMWTKWDSQYYVDIVRNGYWLNPGQQSNVAFFPLYPMLTRIFALGLGGNVILAGFIVANAAFLCALVFLYLLTELEIDVGAARRVVFYLALFPTSFFFNSVYTESLFLLLITATMFFARKRLWLAAALAGMLAAATRNLGVVMWLLVMWEWLRSLGWRVTRIHITQTWRDLWSGLRTRWIELFIIALIPLGMLVYIYFLQQNFGRPMAFIEVQAAWGRQNIGPVAVVLKNLPKLFTLGPTRAWFTLFANFAAFFGFLAMVPFVWRRLGEGYALFVVICLLVPATSALGSIIRYVLPLFPVFIVLADWGRREWVDRVIASSFAVLLGVYTAVFVNWVFVA